MKSIIISALSSTLIGLSMLSLLSFNSGNIGNNLDEMPIGSILIWPGDSPPHGWEICDGGLKHINSYPKLYEVVGGYWNKDKGVNRSFFNLPDLRGVFLRGVSGNRRDEYRDVGKRESLNGKTADSFRVGSFQKDGFKKHDHGGGNHRHDTPVPNIGYSFEHHKYNNRKAKGANSNTPSSYSGQIIKPQGGDETRPKNAYVNFIIKVK